ncbi:unnamed protein product [Rangifer tarandus platyrhynchus]|uniref:Uncharacterized protein n=2 Tax=Rangifer tarandus platyrhynchus TaxID=3082113 RepID=A0AC59YAS8_RANTA
MKKGRSQQLGSTLCAEPGVSGSQPAGSPVSREAAMTPALRLGARGLSSLPPSALAASSLQLSRSDPRLGAVYEDPDRRRSPDPLTLRPRSPPRVLRPPQCRLPEALWAQAGLRVAARGEWRWRERPSLPARRDGAGERGEDEDALAGEPGEPGEPRGGGTRGQRPSLDGAEHLPRVCLAACLTAVSPPSPGAVTAQPSPSDKPRPASGPRSPQHRGLSSLKLEMSRGPDSVPRVHRAPTLRMPLLAKTEPPDACEKF